MPKKAVNEFSATCFDLSAMKAEFAPGVSEPNPVLGFSKSEILHTFKTIQESAHDDLIFITEFNPAIEKIQTGDLIVEIVKQIIMGYQWIN